MYMCIGHKNYNQLFKQLQLYRMLEVLYTKLGQQYKTLFIDRGCRHLDQNKYIRVEISKINPVLTKIIYIHSLKTVKRGM